MKYCLLLASLVLTQVPGFDLILPTITGSSSQADSAAVFDSSGEYQSGRATYYGPNPLYPPGSEAGFQKSDVGVGCSVGNDPRWNEILSRGVKVNPLNPDTVWPTTPTVAVSEAAWGKSLCWKKLVIRSKADPTKMITATVVDLCPANGCLWSKSELAHNVDIYGIDSFVKLGGETTGGKLDLEIMWPAGYVPKNFSFKANSFSGLIQTLSIFTLWLF